MIKGILFLKKFFQDKNIGNKSWQNIDLMYFQKNQFFSTSDEKFFLKIYLKSFYYYLAIYVFGSFGHVWLVHKWAKSELVINISWILVFLKNNMPLPDEFIIISLCVEIKVMLILLIYVEKNYLTKC